MQEQLGLFVKGMAMGAADIVPGVSGGTVAFITGIYERLLGALKSIPTDGLRSLRRDGLNAAWQAIDGNFLLILFGGILFSIFTMAKLIGFVLQAYPVLLWSFFFGLIVASCWHVSRQVKQWQYNRLLAMAVGALLAYGVTELTPVNLEVSPLNLFLAGMVAICAMVLPGISGSFILLILGLYPAVLSAVKGFEIGILSIFAAGCLVGLLSIANVLTWMFKRYHDITLTLLTGFMIGALNKVWPWKQTLSFRENSHGELVPLLQTNVLPGNFELLTGVSSQWVLALICGVIGVTLVLLIEKLSNR